LDAPEEAFDLLPLSQRDDCLLPIGRLADGAGADAPEAAPRLAAHVDGVDFLDLDALRLVLLLERLLDLRLRGARGHLEGVPALGVQLVGALGDERPDDDLARCSRRHSSVSSGSSPRLPRGLKFSSSSSIESFARRTYV